MLIDLQLKYSESKIKKNCIYHKKDAQYFCYKLNCSKCPYMCQFCAQQGGHMHKDKIGNINQFIRNIVAEIQDYQNYYKVISSGDQIDLQSVIKEGADILQAIEKLQNEIIQLINQSKQRIKQQINNNIQNLKKTKNSKVKYYKNANILINKLVSQSSTDFITKLKTTLNQRFQQKSIQKQNSNIKIQLNLLKVTLKQMLQTNLSEITRTSSNQTRQSSDSSRPHVRIAQKKIYQLPIIPQKIFNFNQQMIICGQKAFLFNLQRKTAIPLESPLNLCSFNKNVNQFIGLTKSDNLVFYSDSKLKKTLKINSNCSSLAPLTIRDENYAILGYQNGQIECISYKTQNSIFKSKNHNSKINNISIISIDRLIICSSKDGNVSLYSYQLYQGQLKIEFISYLISNTPELVGHQIINKQIVLYNSFGNIKIIDYNLNQIVLESNLTRQNAIADLLVVPTSKGYFLLIQNSHQPELKMWSIDRQRSTYKIESTSFFIKKNQMLKNSMFLWNDNLWILKENKPQIYVTSIQFI